MNKGMFLYKKYHADRDNERLGQFLVLARNSL